MYQQIDCIALRTVRYNDRNSILSVYTRRAGLLSFLVPATAGREATRRRALLMPGSRFTAVADIRPDGRLRPMRDIAPRGVPPSGMVDPVNSAIRLLLVDILATMLREPMPDTLLFDYCDLMLERLDSFTKPAPNFHLCFLVGLMQHVGIRPDTSTYHRGYVLDIADGLWRSSAPLHGRFLVPDDSVVAHSILRMNVRNMHLYRLTAAQRNTILDRLLDYYTHHFTPMHNLRSLDILRSLF